MQTVSVGSIGGPDILIDCDIVVVGDEVVGMVWSFIIASLVLDVRIWSLCH